MNQPDGYALVAAIWLMAVIASVTATTTSGIALLRRTTANRVEHATAMTAARVCIFRTELDLLASRQQQMQRSAAFLPWHGYTANGKFADFEYTVSVRDPRSALNLNTAEVVEVERLLQAKQRADSISATIAVLADLMLLQPHVRYEDVGPLPGFVPRPSNLFSLFTVAGDGLINLHTAPVEVLQTLPGVTITAAQAIVAGRSQGYTTVFAVLALLSLPDRLRLEKELPQFGAKVTLDMNSAEILCRVSENAASRSSAILAYVSLAGDSIHEFWRAEL